MDYQKDIQNLTLLFLSKPVPFDRQNYQKQNKPVHDIINYSPSICPFEPAKFGKEGKKLLKFEYVENEKRSFDEVKTFLVVFEGLSFGEKIKI